MRCRYNEVNFLHNSHNIHPMAHLCCRDMGCLLWFSYLIHFLPLLSQCPMSNRDKFRQCCNGTWLYHACLMMQPNTRYCEESTVCTLTCEHIPTLLRDCWWSLSIYKYSNNGPWIQWSQMNLNTIIAKCSEIINMRWWLEIFVALEI